MHDIWNPWHGCTKKSEGCKHCYMYFLDKQRGGDGSRIYKVKNNFEYPLSKDKNGRYKIKSGEHIRVCMTSDFFLEEADKWREDAWKIMHKRSDVVFILITKRPERIAQVLPSDWGDGYENVQLNVTCETNNEQTNVFRFCLICHLNTRALLPLLSSVRSVLKNIFRPDKLNRLLPAEKIMTVHAR